MESQQNLPLGVGTGLHLTDQQCIISYLRPKNEGNGVSPDDSLIAEVDFYEWDPWELPSKSKIQSDDGEWYFFHRVAEKVTRKTRSGGWGITGKENKIVDENARIGVKKYLTWKPKKVGLQDKYGWAMHECSLPLPFQQNYVLCRLIRKRAGIKKHKSHSNVTPNLEKNHVSEENGPANGKRSGLVLQPLSLSCGNINSDCQIPGGGGRLDPKPAVDYASYCNGQRKMTRSEELKFVTDFPFHDLLNTVDISSRFDGSGQVGSLKRGLWNQEGPVSSDADAGGVNVPAKRPRPSPIGARL